MEGKDELMHRRRKRYKVVVPHHDQQDPDPSGNINEVDSSGHVGSVSTVDCTSEQDQLQNARQTCLAAKVLSMDREKVYTS